MTPVLDRVHADRDLVGAAGVGVLLGVWSVLGPTAVVALPLAAVAFFVLPGYVTTALVRADRGKRGLTDPESTLVGRLETAALSLGLSLAVVSLLVFAAFLSPFGPAPSVVVAVVGGYVVAAALVAAVRRGPPARKPSSASASTSAAGWLDRLLDGVLVVSIVLAAATLGGAVLAPSHGDTTTDLHLLTESEGQLVANEYPDEVTQGEQVAITVGVTNDEHEAVQYSLIAQLERVRVGDGSVTVQERTTVRRAQFALDHGSSWQRQVAVQPSMSGEDLRLTVYLYRGDPPSTPSTGTAYRHTFIWLDVQPSP